MVPLTETLAELSELSKTLNVETDELNNVISKVQHQLAAMRVGVSVWSMTLLDERIERSLNPAEPEGTGVSRGYVLGYAKLPDGWAIAYKAVQQVSGYGDQDPTCRIFYEHIDESDPDALLNAPRLIRVQAAAQLEDLLKLLKNRVKEFIGNIDAAKKLVEGTGEEVARRVDFVHEFKADLCDRVGYQSEWRDQKAEEYPEDDRNEKSAKALRELATRLSNLPDENPKLQRLWSLCEKLYESGDPTESTEIESELLRDYGFNAPGEGDPDEFLQDYINAIEPVVR